MLFGMHVLCNTLDWIFQFFLLQFYIENFVRYMKFRPFMVMAAAYVSDARHCSRIIETREGLPILVLMILIDRQKSRSL